MSKLKDRIGQRYGKLTVTGREPNRQSPNGNWKTYWKCVCDCGKETIVGSCSLEYGTKSCGCLWLESVQSKDWIKAEYDRYNRQSAQRRNIPWNISVEKFKEIILKNCFYCGSEPSVKTHSGGQMRNGLDRIDHRVEYNDENCIPCCWECNRMKGRMSQKEFYDIIEKIIKNKPCNGGIA